jgi:hypothetical protein
LNTPDYLIAVPAALGTTNRRLAWILTGFAAQATGIFNKDASPTRTYRVSLGGDDRLVWVDEEKGREVRYYREPLAGFWLRFSGRLFYLFIPEAML